MSKYNRLLPLFLGICCIGLMLFNEIRPSLLSNYSSVRFWATLVQSTRSKSDLGEVLINPLSNCLPTDERMLSFERVLAIEPNHISAHRGNAIARLVNGDCQGAISELEETLQLEPDNKIAWFWLGKAYYDNQQNKKALEAWKKLVDTNITQLFLNLGWQAYHEEHVEEGVEWATWAANLDSLNSEAATLLALLYWQESLPDQAQQWSIKAHDLGTQEIMVYVNMCSHFLWGENNFKTALHWCDTGLERVPDSPWLSFYRGWVFLKMNDIEQALFNFQKARREGPEIRDAHLITGRIFANMEHWPEAIEAYQAAITINKSDITVVCELAEVYWKANLLEQAAVAYQSCLELDPNNLFAQERLNELQPNELK